MLTKLLKIYTAITMGRKGGYYAVRTGRQTGVFQTWYETIFELDRIISNSGRKKTRIHLRAFV